MAAYFSRKNVSPKTIPQLISRSVLSRKLWLGASLGLLAPLFALGGCTGKTPQLAVNERSADWTFTGKVEWKSQNGPLLNESGVAEADVIVAPNQIRSGEYFTIHIGSEQMPGGRRSGNARKAVAIIHPKGASEALWVYNDIYPSAEGPRDMKVWSVDIRGRLAPSFRGDNQSVELEIALLDRKGSIGSVKSLILQLVEAEPPNCPLAGKCEEAECGFENQCNNACGKQVGKCQTGFSCTPDMTCEKVGAACDDKATVCDNRSCGEDPFNCGVECGECTAGMECGRDGQCQPDSGAKGKKDSEKKKKEKKNEKKNKKGKKKPPKCKKDEVLCEGECIDPTSDPKYCGAWGNCSASKDGQECRLDERCDNGKCVDLCVGSEIFCDGSCIDPRSDRNYCGASNPCDKNPGQRCKPDEVCSVGVCKKDCAVNEVLCNGTCIKPASHNYFCGAKDDCIGDENDGEVCGSNELCSEGICRPNCSSGEIECFGKCVNPSNNPSFCGASGDCNGASKGEVCKIGKVCSKGVCVKDCPSGLIECEGDCIDPKTDLNYCGARDNCEGYNRGQQCRSGERCTGSRCENPCPNFGEVLCAGNCIEPMTDRRYCGARLDCEGGRAGVRCEGDENCVRGICRPVEKDCSNIVFEDHQLEEAVRRAITKPTGPISEEDLSATELKTTGLSGKIRELDGLECWRSLKVLNLNNQLVSNLEPLSELKNLTHLHLSGNQIYDLGPLRKLKRLRHLDLSSTGIDDISDLIRLQNLTYLNLSGNYVGDVTALGQLSLLQTLDLSNNHKWHLRQITKIGLLDELRHLYLQHNTNLKPSSLVDALDRKPELKTLDLTMVNDEITLNVLERIQVIDSLETLKMAGNNIGQAGLRKLKELRNLTLLNIAKTGIENLEPLRGMRNLETLIASDNKNLKATKEQFTVLDPLAPLVDLKTLDLSHCHITEVIHEKSKPLRSLKKLKTLILSNNLLKSFVLPVVTKNEKGMDSTSYTFAVVVSETLGTLNLLSNGWSKDSTQCTELDNALLSLQPDKATALAEEYKTARALFNKAQTGCTFTDPKLSKR